MEAVRRLKKKLEPFAHQRLTPELRGGLKVVIMRFFETLKRSEELPLNNPFMRVADVHVVADDIDPQLVHFRFTDDRGATVDLPLAGRHR